MEYLSFGCFCLVVRVKVFFKLVEASSSVGFSTCISEQEMYNAGHFYARKKKYKSLKSLGPTLSTFGCWVPGRISHVWQVHVDASYCFASLTVMVKFNFYSDIHGNNPLIRKEVHFTGENLLHNWTDTYLGKSYGMESVKFNLCTELLVYPVFEVHSKIRIHSRVEIKANKTGYKC